MMILNDRMRRTEARRHDIARLEYLYRFAVRWYERYWSTQLETLARANVGQTGFAEGHAYTVDAAGGWDFGHSKQDDTEFGLLARKRFRTLLGYGGRVRVMSDALDAALRRHVYDQVVQWRPHTGRLVCVNVNGRPYWYAGKLDPIPSVSRVAWSDEDALILTVGDPS